MIGYMEMIQVDEKPAIRDNFNTVGFSASSHSGAIREAVVSENPGGLNRSVQHHLI